MHNRKNHPSKVLIVDDNEVLREVLHDFLIFLYPNCQIFEAENGKRGLEFAQQVQPTLIFLDFNMPIMNGYEIALRLQNSPNTRAIPRVLTSAGNSEHPQVIQLRTLCQATLDKPFKLAALERVVEQVIALQQ